MSLEKLLAGFRDFKESYFEQENLFEDLVKNGQSPETLVIACSDSRNDPALLTQSDPGDIFVIRNVAAIVPPYEPDDHYHGTSSAIEFAVKGLKVKNIVVLGHSLCGGVQCLAEGSKPDQFEFLSEWVKIGDKARADIEQSMPNAPKEEKLPALEKAVILESLNNLMTFPWVKSAVDAGSLSLHGWYFDMVNGKLLSYDNEAQDFIDNG